MHAFLASIALELPSLWGSCIQSVDSQVECSLFRGDTGGDGCSKMSVCGETEPVKKHGTGKGGHPRYRCQACSRTFQLEYTYRACQAGMKAQIVDLTMNNAGTRDTTRALHVSINTVVRTLKRFRHDV